MKTNLAGKAVMHKQSIHARQVCCNVKYIVSHAPNCRTQISLKVMTACRKESIAVSASCAPPMKSSRKKAMTHSSSVRAAGEACAVGKLAIAARKATLRGSCLGQCNNTCCTTSMLFGCSQAGHLQSFLSWLGWSLNLLSCCRDMEAPKRSWKRIKAAWCPWLSVLRCRYALKPGPS